MRVLNDEKIVRSPNLISLKNGKDLIVYNTIFGNPVVVSRETMQFLGMFKKPSSLSEVAKRCSIDGAEYWAKFFLKRRILNPLGFDERRYVAAEVNKGIKRISKGSELISLGLVLDERCNFDCSYCISKKMVRASGRSSTNGERMLWPVARRAVDQFVSFVTEKGQADLEVYFGGSEPLLNWNLMRKVIEYCNDIRGLRFTYSANSNLGLLTSQKAKYMAQNGMTVTTSLDGPPSINDRIRRYASGAGTYHQIIRGWDLISRYHKPVEWFCLTLTDENIDDVGEEFFDFLSNRGIKTCSFEPDIIQPFRREPEKVVKALLRFKKMGVERGITVGGMWDKPIKNLFEPNIRKRLFDCSAFTGRGISVLPSGEVVPCTYSGTKLGRADDLSEFFCSERFQAFLASRAIGNLEACKGCEIEGQCLGGCLITTEYGDYTDSKEAFEYRCEVYKLITRELLKMAV